MDIKISENIRALRKERKMTQEQLAEAFGVTIGAVSKWEAGQSTPEISVIMKMAEYFETSIDVLLGYELRQGSLGRSIDEIKALRNEKRFDEAIARAEQALQKYPNIFELTHTCAIMFTMAGIESGNKRNHQRALMLLERALDLVGQNKDPKINEWTIRNTIADVHLCLGNTDQALELMKANNAVGIKNSDIGFLLTVNKKQPDEGLPYLSNALVDCVSKLLRVSFAYANAYEQKGKLNDAASILQWILGVIDGLRNPGQISHLDKECVELFTGLACVAAQAGDEALVEQYLTRAYEAAVAYDRAPDSGFSQMKHYHSIQPMMAFDDFGCSAVDGIRDELCRQERESGMLISVWDRIVVLH